MENSVTGEPVVEQWRIVFLEDQWWSSGEYCYKRTSGGAVGNIVTRGPVVEQWRIVLQEDQWWSSGENCYKRTSG